MDKEFVPLDAFQRSFKFWWLIALAALVGGLFGYGFHRLFPPEYEAVARFEGTIDFTQIDTSKLENQELTLGDQDQTLHSIDVMVLRMRQPALDALRQQEIELTYSDLERKSRLERMQALWELRFRHRDPGTAQAVVNTWAQLVVDGMESALAAGDLPPYIIFNPVETSPLPDQPRYFQTNLLVLAGCVLGLVVGAGLALSLGSLGRSQA